MIGSQNLRGGMRSKILLLAIVPVLSISVILSWYYIRERRSDLAMNMHQAGASTANYLATASELAMFADDMESLRQIAKGPTTSPAVHRVIFYDASGNPVLSIGPPDGGAPDVNLEQAPWIQDQFRDEPYWYFRSAILLDAEIIADYGEG